MGDEQFTKIAQQAEADLNSYQAKTGANKTSPSDEAGVDTRVENKFPGAEVRYDKDLSTNAGFNKRIPTEEGGELDDRGRATTGEWFEGKGGPEDKLQKGFQDHGGNDDNDVPGGRVVKPSAREYEDVADQGKEAAAQNVDGVHPKQQFKGVDYYEPETVPDSISAEGNIPPASVTQASHEAEVGGFK